MRKRFISMFLAFIMSISLTGAALAVSDPCAAFRDVDRSAWYHTALDYVVKNRLMSGTSSTTFAPKNTVSRAMVLQTFYAIAGRPAFSGKSAFRDVSPENWYFESVNWGAEHKLAAGYGEGLFRPDDNVTREQLAVFFKAFAGYTNKDTVSRRSLAGFKDRDRISGYATDAMSWAVAVGLLSGKGDGKLAPKDTAIRAELAQMLYRFASVPDDSDMPVPSPQPSETTNPTRNPKPTPSVSPEPSETSAPSETPAPSATPTPKKPFEIITFPTSEIWMYVGEQIQMMPKPYPEDSDEVLQLQWETLDRDVVALDENGVVTAKKAGKAKIRATANNRHSASYTVYVMERTERPITGVKISDSELIIASREKHRLSATVLPSNTTETGALRWSSDKNSVASVDLDGQVTGYRAGTATITVTCNGKFMDTCKVTVYEVTAALSEKQVSVEPGQTHRLRCIKDPLDDTAVQWSSDNPEVASVRDGIITAHKPGAATITATVGEASDTCTVYVNGFIDVGRLYREVNEFRTGQGVWYWNSDNTTKTVFNTGSGNTLTPLSIDAALEETARIRAKELVVSFSHTRPDGSRCFTAYPNYSTLGENIAMGTDNLINIVITLWEENPMDYSGQGHRRNMLNPDFNAVGMAGYYYNGRSYWTQSLGRR